MRARFRGAFMQRTWKWSLVLVAIAGVVVTLRMSVTSRDARAGETGAPFREPEVRRSANGVLKTTLDLRLGTYTVAGRVLELPMYEGSIPGPTFRLQPGDRLQIRYANNLKFPDSVAAMIAKLPMPSMPASTRPAIPTSSAPTPTSSSMPIAWSGRCDGWSRTGRGPSRSEATSGP